MGQKLKLTPKKIIEISTTNMNIKPSVKYGISPENIESKSLSNERFNTLFKKTSKLNARLDRFDKKIYQRKRKKLRENLNVGERLYILAERIKKKSTPGKFYKQSVQNNSYFNKETIYIIRKKKIAGGIRYYWVKSPLTDLGKRFQRTELFALQENFI